MGGEKVFANMLDSVFIVPPVFDDSYYGQVIHEIREMTVMNMGNYAHGNQPIQHMIYLYNYIGQPWKAQYWLRQVMNRMYTPGPDGYCGDEDNGQTSAWYVFSALGFYPVCPGTDEYVLGAPLFKKAVLHFENGEVSVRKIIRIRFLRKSVGSCMFFVPLHSKKLPEKHENNIMDCQSAACNMRMYSQTDRSRFA